MTGSEWLEVRPRRPWLVGGLVACGALLAGACSGGSSDACNTTRDCSGAQQCVRGRCVGPGVDPDGGADGGRDGDGGDPSDGGSDGARDGMTPGAGFTLTLVTEEVHVPQDGADALVFRIDRAADFSESVTVAAYGLPDGVSVEEPALIEAGASEGELVFAASRDAALGATEIEVAARGGPFESMAMARLHVGGPSGTVDARFGDGAGIVHASGAIPAMVRDVAVQPDGRILLAGAVGSEAEQDAAVMRVLADGTPDPSFGSEAVVTTDFAGAADDARSLLLQPDGKIVIAGRAGGGAPPNGVGLIRYLSDGTPDPEFGEDGRVTGPGAAGQAAALQPDGKIIVAGSAPPRGVVMRWLPDGTLDPTFGTEGVVMLAAEGSVTTALRHVAIQADGKVVVCGHTAAEGVAPDVLIARYQPDGTLDDEFGTAGIVTTDVAQGQDVADTVIVAPSGELLVQGTVVDSTWNYLAARYLPNGTLDTTFNAAGIVLTDFEEGRDDAADAVLDGRHRLVLVGMVEAVDGNLGLVRHRPDGTLDPGFGEGGRSVLPFDLESGVEVAIAIAPDGALIVVGTILAPEGNTGVGWTRVWP